MQVLELLNTARIMHIISKQRIQVELISLERENSWIGIIKLLRAEAIDVRHTVDVVAEGTEAWVGYQVEGEEPSQEENQQERDTDYEQDTLTK